MKVLCSALVPTAIGCSPDISIFSWQAELGCDLQVCRSDCKLHVGANITDVVDLPHELLLYP